MNRSSVCRFASYLVNRQTGQQANWQTEESWKNAFKPLLNFGRFISASILHRPIGGCILSARRWALIQIIYGLATQRFWMLLTALVTGYAFAWIGHFFLEKNKPATFTYPWFSFLGDWKMWSLMMTGRLASEMRKLELESKLD